MRRPCDRLWLQMNRGFLIAGVCTLPAAVVFPVASFVFPAALLFLTCNRFFTFSNTGDSHEDSLRFIRTLPYSRGQVFETYGKGICVVCLLYVLALLLLRLALLSAGLRVAFLWVGNLTTEYELVLYVSELTLFFICCGILLLRLPRNYTASSRSTYISMMLFFIFPAVFVCNYLKLFFLLLSGFTKIIIGKSYEFSDLMKLSTLPAETAEILSVAVVWAVIIVLSVVLARTVRRSKNTFCGEGAPCLRR